MSTALVLPALLALSMVFAAPAAGSGEVAVPAAPGALAANLSASGLLSWLEPVEGQEGLHRLRYARPLDDGGWGAAATITESDNLFTNWADLPAVTELADGSLVAHWLVKTGADPYAYGVKIARSEDGESWQDAGWLHQDRSETEHGFVSWAPRPEGGVWAFWLDGGAMMSGGPMQIRGKLLNDSSPKKISTEKAPAAEEKILDPRVCECCTTSAALAADGPVVVYRGRSDNEIRDIRVVRRTTEGWSSPKTVADDGWRLSGCPVNGPAIAAQGRRVAVAWFTAAEDRPRVRLAVSTDGGDSFAAPVEIAEGKIRGRVDVVLAEDGTAVVSWLGRYEDEPAVLLSTVSPDGQPGPTRFVAATSGARSSGFPRLALDQDHLRIVWRNPAGAGELHGQRWSMAELKAAPPASSKPRQPAGRR